MKKSVNFAFYIMSVLLLVTVLCSCEEEEVTAGLKELGIQAADEFCDCFKKNSEDDCLDKLTSKYKRTDYMTDTFIDAFNKQSSCDIMLEKVTVP